MEHIVSIRIPFPEKISEVLRREKARFVTEYGSKYTSEPHITLYLEKRYTPDGFPKLIQDLQKLPLQPFEITLLKPKVIVEEGRHRNLYVVDVSSKERLQELHEEVSHIAARYHEQNMVRVASTYDPHITLGEIDLDDPQAELTEVQKNLEQLEGEKVLVSSLAVFFHGKEPGMDKAQLIEEVRIPFQ